MRNYKETLTKDKEIRKQVVIGIFQFFGYILLGLVILVAIWGLLYVPYSIGKEKGYSNGVDDEFNYILTWIHNAPGDTTLTMTNSSGTSVSFISPPTQGIYMGMGGKYPTSYGASGTFQAGEYTSETEAHLNFGGFHKA